MTEIDIVSDQEQAERGGTSLSFTRFTQCTGKTTRWWSRPAGLGVWFWVGFWGLRSFLHHLSFLPFLQR